MKRTLLSALLQGTLLTAGLSSSLAAQTPFVNTLMPVPAHLTAATGSLPWNDAITVGLPRFRDSRLDAAIVRTLQQMERTTGVHRPSTLGNDPSAKLVIDVEGPGETIQTIDEDEAYTLLITPAGAKLHAATTVGAMRGLTTLTQLVQNDGTGFFLPAVQIDDTPRFRWRGLMIDTGRHFEPIDVIKRNLDAMAAVKLNVFHWHLTEDQGFRIESKLYPGLTAKGSDGLYYTQDQAREIVAYTHARGIRVVPEFEMPGHSVAWLVAYPKLASGSIPTGIRREFGVSNYALDPTREETYQFIQRFLTEMTGLFPDAYYHIGGDETPAPDWKTNPRILAFKKQHNLKDNDALQAYFNTRVLAILTGLHKHMVGWDEIFTPGLPTDAVIQSWRGAKSLVSAAKQGYQGILSQPWYLDGMQSAERHYLADPIPAGSDLTPEQSKRILGGETPMWGEQLNQLSIDSRIWPRTAAIAERFWSPADVRDVDDMYRRLDVESIRLEALGLTHLTHQDAALRELAGTENIDALRVFASVLQPVSFGERYKGQHTDQLTPLDNLVDAVRPDPPSRHRIEVLVRNLLASPANQQAKAELDSAFKSWLSAVPVVEEQMQHSPLLNVAHPRAQQLGDLAQTGEEALSYLGGSTKAPAGWKQGALAQIEEARKNQALLRFTFLDPLEQLIKAAQE
ncbi:MAG TPA: family 20 glycosylhydrolase [Edaphobacter sp.]